MTSLSSDSNVVLKINLGENGTRRIPLSNVWDESTCSVSFDRLLDLIHAFQETPQKVTVTYTDEDGDEITISTSQELTQAFEQFVDKVPPVLRATAIPSKANNIPNKNHQKQQQQQSNKKVQVYTQLRDAISEIRAKVQSQASNLQHSSPRMRQMYIINVLDSILIVLTQALDTLAKPNGNVNTPPTVEEIKKAFGGENVNDPKPTRPEDSSPVRPVQSGCVRRRIGGRPNENSTPRQIQAYKMQARRMARSEAEKRRISQQVMKKVMANVMQDQPKDDDKNQTLPNKTVMKQSNMVPLRAKPVPTAAAVAVPPQPVHVVPAKIDFIHGRHTCDGCLVTPIIGTRYHASNVPDYDLCSKCFPNYKGTDITFVPEELDRDRHLQSRWRRREKMRVSKEEAVAVTTAKADSEDSKSILYTMDQALKEAIRRSLEESFPKNQGKEPVPVDKKEEVETEMKETPSSEPFPVEKKEKVETEKETPSSEAIPVEEEKDIQVKEKVVSRTPSDVESEKKEESKSQQDESISKMTDDLKLEAEVVSVASQETEIVVDDDENTDKTHAKENSRDFSFTEGAEDAVAVAIGTTLDKCADAIDALGLSSSNSSTHSFNKVSVASLQSEKEGEILPAVEDDIVSSDVASVKSEDEWQCVEDVSDEFAKAAQLLGSAMFQSDIAAPSEEFGDSFTSDLTSIPTLTSEISQVLLARWEKHLRQLHELGFLDDHVNVNALEHLEAANIGCSSDDEISVNAAVEHILKNKD